MLVGQAQTEEVRQLTQASYAQNEEIKKISAWAAIFRPHPHRDRLRHELRLMPSPALLPRPKTQPGSDLKVGSGRVMEDTTSKRTKVPRRPWVAITPSASSS